MDSSKDYRDHLPPPTSETAKATLFSSSRILLGLNRLEPGAEQSLHTHEGQDKFYHVLEGTGLFTVGDEVGESGPGSTVWAPSGIDHGVRNEGTSSLILLVGIAPAPSKADKQQPAQK